MKTTTVYTGIVTLALYIEYNRFAMASLIGLRHLLNYLFGMHPFVFLLPRSNPIVGLECWRMKNVWPHKCPTNPFLAFRWLSGLWWRNYCKTRANVWSGFSYIILLKFSSNNCFTKTRSPPRFHFYDPQAKEPNFWKVTSILGLSFNRFEFDPFTQWVLSSTFSNPFLC